MEIKYQIFENDNLLVHRLIGEFSIEKYIAYTRFITSQVIQKQIFKVLVDFRMLAFPGAFTEVSDRVIKNVDEVSEIRKNINKNELKDKNVVLVFWADKPLPAVVAHLFIERISKSNYHYCSRDEKIVEILKLPENFKELNKIVDNLEFKFEETP